MAAQLVAFLVGVGVTAAPGVFGYGLPARGVDHVVGPLAATVGMTAAFGATRSLRWLNVPLGAWLVVAPWVLGYGRTEAVVSTVAGLLLAGLAYVGGRAHSLGGGWQVLWNPTADPVPAATTANAGPA